MFEEITKNTKTQSEKDKTKNFAYLYELMAVIDSVDDEKMDFIHLQTFLRNLPMRDMNIINSYNNKLIDSIGFDSTLKFECDKCGSDYEATFRIGSDFFRPNQVD